MLVTSPHLNLINLAISAPRMLTVIIWTIWYVSGHAALPTASATRPDPTVDVLHLCTSFC